MSSMCPRYSINLGSNVCVLDMRIEAKLSREAKRTIGSGREKARVRGMVKNILNIQYILI